MFNPLLQDQHRATPRATPSQVSAPAGVDYESLARRLVGAHWEPEVEDDVASGALDLRVATFTLDDMAPKVEVGELEDKSIIPVPGLMINYEQDESTTAPIVSDWIAPNGPVWER